MRTVFLTGAGGVCGQSLAQTPASVRLRRGRGRSEPRTETGLRTAAHQGARLRRSRCDQRRPCRCPAVRPDGVVHLAGIARPSDASEEPLQGYQSIVTAWANVLDAVRRTVPRAKVVMASAGDVYGEAGSGGQPLSESTPARPVTTFGSLKRTAETIAHNVFSAIIG